MDFGSNLGHQHWILTIPRNINDFLLIFGFSNKQTRNFFFFFYVKKYTHGVFTMARGGDEFYAVSENK